MHFRPVQYLNIVDMYVIRLESIVGIKLTSYYKIPCFCLRCLSPKQNNLPNFIVQNKEELVISWIM